MPSKKHLHPRPLRRHRSHVGMAALLVLAAALLLAACGGGSSSTATSTNSAATTKQGGSTSSRFASLQACLKKQGINFSAPTGGSGSGGPPSGGAGGFKLPEGVSRSKLQEALKKCGGGGFPKGARSGFNSASARTALTKYASCMRENGVNLPTPNTSGSGPVFDTKGIDTSSEKFKKARKACQSDLKGTFGAGRPPAGGGEGGPPGGGEGGTPPGGGEGGTPPGAEGSGA